jgi:hypothetical protein
VGYKWNQFCGHKKSEINFVNKYKKIRLKEEEKYKILSKLDHLNQHTSLSFLPISR